MKTNFETCRKYLQQTYEESLKESEAVYKESGGDLLDLDIPVSIPLFDGLHSIRNANLIKEKLYIDTDNKIIRYDYINNKQENDGRNEAVIYLTSQDNRLSDVITQLPYGLIDKQATGIGATYLEMHCERNSIIVVPTRALGENKCSRNSSRFLYVGTRKHDNKVTSEGEIVAYLNNDEIKFKKIIVVADSLKKVVDTISAKGIDVYRSYFLMVDEIDTIQSDNHYRPQLSVVIDYYYKFKLQRRALVSATVKEFSHPKLQAEPLTTIKRIEPLKRTIIIKYTDDINKLLKDEIIRVASENCSEKILIAYNSITDIMSIILKLPSDLQNQCGILCSEASYDKVPQSQRAEINEEDRLSHEIVFMTCAFFAGIDIVDRCHLISVSNVQYGYCVLPINKITQIGGRCRNGVLSDTIIHNIYRTSHNYLHGYKAQLQHKADMVVQLLKAANALKQADESICDLFDRIESVIIEKADINVTGQTITLTRRNIDDEFDIAYFNIDMLYEQMITNSLLYSQRQDLYNKILNNGHNVRIINVIFGEEIENNNNIIVSGDARMQRIQTCIDEIVNISSLNDSILNYKIRQARSFEKLYYSRVKELYRYVNLSILNQILLDLCIKNEKAYNNFRNAVYFWALAESHPFKQLIESNFVVSERYSNDEIEKRLLVIIKDQLFIKQSIGRHKCVSLFKACVDFTYTQGRYIVRGYISKNFIALRSTSPLSNISENESSTKYFKI